MNNCTVVNILRQRSSGILLPIFSLPGPHGIGDLGHAALRFIDFLKAAGQSCWQILPLGPTSPLFGNSPYMSPSAFAGSPLLINPDLLVEQGLVRRREILPPDCSEYSVDYHLVARHKAGILALAWQRFQLRSDWPDILETFAATHPWCLDYALFVALKQRHQGKPWYGWPEEIRHRRPTALAAARRAMREQVDAVVFEQYLFFGQWQHLRDHARRQGIRLIGDLPIYVALDSADAWANQDIFQLDRETGLPTDVAGVPPDYFSATGQRWGNPLYRWTTGDDLIRDRLWDWWEQRLRLNFMLTDTLRIDHFRGFAAYWAVPAEEETALNGRWLPGPGQPFFEEMDRRLGGMSIIAEDLGLITPDVATLRDTLGYPGMKVLLFAFDGDPRNSYLPYNTEKNSVVYTGTHDNDTAVGWFLNPDVTRESKRRAKRFANRSDDHAGSFHQELIHLALASPANLAILPMQDVLGFGNDCRLNTPGVLAGNWQWRCAERFVNKDVAAWLSDLTTLFGRVPPESDCQTGATQDP
ncbi:4-alpha-glucanotransferase [Desulfobulbus elongatus]|uniref:4-alpha-glucanotransferase n=1 Tax=Desulfobulbus elongatus TaxID=53332 RepID=UPI0005531908|nr:4-alpha-glucanotransferase [Desulfobulbus elongatus]